MAKPAKTSDSLIKEAREAFNEAESAESENRINYREDLKFAREGIQWPDKIAKMREIERRPMLTINKLEAYIRQVVNDARQNKPSIKVHPVDSGADPETAKVIDGLIRNIEYTSDADVAYDTATECAVSGGFGYLRVALDYAYEDSFDLDIVIKRVANPLSVYGDPNPTGADSADWNYGFVTERLTKAQFEAQYKGKAKVDWEDSSWSDAGGAWRDGDNVTVAEYWKRDEYEKPILMLSNGLVIDAETLKSDPDMATLRESGAVQVVRQRMTKCHRVKQCIMSGVEILEENPWLGKYIPIIPVYGLEFYIDGKRVLRSLIHNSKDAQRMFNYQRTTSTELIALTPKVPFIGPKGSFDSDQANWNTANQTSHSYLEFDPVPGQPPPQRQPLDFGPAAGAIQEAMNASDDIKATIGMYDASLGARSNETSGRAIMARQREGDVATFHFADNTTRAVRHTGRILIDLIPKIYTNERVIRVLGEDGKPSTVQLGQPQQVIDPKTGQPMVDERGEAVVRIHDLSLGKYDLTVKAGPSFTSRREEAAYQMTELIRGFPAAAPIVAPIMAKNLDWPEADTIAEKMEAQASGQLPPEVQQQMEQGQQMIAQLQEENQNLKMDQAAEMAKIEAQKQADAVKLQAQQQTDQMKLESSKQIEFVKIQANEQIEMAKIASEERIALAKARIQAQASVQAAAMKPQPTGNANGQPR